MTSKISSVHNSPDRLLGENINYSLDYEYDEQYAYRAKRIGNRYYAYDGNGNVVLEQDEPIKPKEEHSYEIHELRENLYGVEYGWALENDEKNQQNSHSIYQRRYTWNEKNLLKESSDTRHTGILPLRSGRTTGAKKALKDARKNYLPEKIRDNVIDEILNYVKKNSED